MIADKLHSRLKKGAGRIIWSYDPKFNEIDPFDKFKGIFEKIHDQIVAIKFNRQFILPHGLKNKDLLKTISIITDADIPLIMDAKVNDIGYTNESIATNYFSAGFDALICNPFIGFDALNPIISTADKFSKEVIFLVYMSHPSAYFGYGRKIYLTADEQHELGKESCYYYELFAHIVNKLQISGALVGATYPEKIKEIRGKLNSDKFIISPGVGAQNGEAKKSRDSGMDYAIIGREITEGNNPSEYCEKMKSILQ